MSDSTDADGHRPLNGEEAICYCGRGITFDTNIGGGRWQHNEGAGLVRCYPDDPRDAEMMAEPDPHANTDCEDICMSECQGACGVLREVVRLERSVSAPAHLINVPGEKRSLCGIKNPLPIMCAYAVPLHREHYDLMVCPECEALAPESPWRPSWM